MLEAVREEDQMEVLQQVTGCAVWVVMFEKGKEKDAVAYLEGLGAARCELDYKERPARYKKGWWQTGDKGLCKGKAWEVWCLDGTDTVKWRDLGETLVLPWMGAQPRHRQDLTVYINGTP